MGGDLLKLGYSFTQLLHFEQTELIATVDSTIATGTHLPVLTHSIFLQVKVQTLMRWASMSVHRWHISSMNSQRGSAITVSKQHPSPNYRPFKHGAHPLWGRDVLKRQRKIDVSGEMRRPVYVGSYLMGICQSSYVLICFCHIASQVCPRYKVNFPHTRLVLSDSVNKSLMFHNAIRTIFIEFIQL